MSNVIMKGPYFDQNAEVWSVLIEFDKHCKS